MRHIFGENLTLGLLFHDILVSHSSFNVTDDVHSNRNKPAQLVQGTEEEDEMGQCLSKSLWNQFNPKHPCKKTGILVTFHLM